MEYLFATEYELGEIRLLNNRCIPHVNRLSEEKIEEIYKQARYFSIIKHGLACFGFIIAFDDQSDYDSVNYQYFRENYKNFLYIDRIIIDEEHQGKGLAKGFYNNLIRYAQSKGVDKLVCEYNIEPRNEISEKFHKDFGFVEVGRQKTEGGTKEVSLQLFTIQ